MPYSPAPSRHDRIFHALEAVATYARTGTPISAVLCAALRPELDKLLPPSCRKLKLRQTDDNTVLIAMEEYLGNYLPEGGLENLSLIPLWDIKIDSSRQFISFGIRDRTDFVSLWDWWQMPDQLLGRDKKGFNHVQQTRADSGTFKTLGSPVKRRVHVYIEISLIPIRHEQKGPANDLMHLAKGVSDLLQDWWFSSVEPTKYSDYNPLRLGMQDGLGSDDIYLVGLIPTRRLRAFNAYTCVLASKRAPTTQLAAAGASPPAYEPSGLHFEPNSLAPSDISPLLNTIHPPISPPRYLGHGLPPSESTSFQYQQHSLMQTLREDLIYQLRFLPSDHPLFRPETLPMAPQEFGNLYGNNLPQSSQWDIQNLYQSRLDLSAAHDNSKILQETFTRQELLDNIHYQRPSLAETALSPSSPPALPWDGSPSEPGCSRSVPYQFQSTYETATQTDEFTWSSNGGYTEGCTGGDYQLNYRTRDALGRRGSKRKSSRSSHAESTSAARGPRSPRKVD